MLRIAVFLAMLSWLALPAASGAVTLSPVSQDREVSVEIRVTTETCPPPSEPPFGCFPPTSTTIDDYSDSDSAPDFGSFTATATDPSFTSTESWQSSSISPLALLASGTWNSHAESSVTFIGPPIEMVLVTEHHVSQNRYEVSFELNQTAAFSLTGALALLMFGDDANASIDLVGPGETPVTGIDLQLGSGECDWANQGEMCEASLSESGLLAPGIYTLRA
jgi:hypothetical protein